MATRFSTKGKLGARPRTKRREASDADSIADESKKEVIDMSDVQDYPGTVAILENANSELVEAVNSLKVELERSKAERVALVDERADLAVRAQKSEAETREIYAAVRSLQDNIREELRQFAEENPDQRGDINDVLRNVGLDPLKINKRLRYMVETEGDGEDDPEDSILITVEANAESSSRGYDGAEWEVLDCHSEDVEFDSSEDSN